MAGLPPPPLQDAQGSFGWLEWYRQLRDYLSIASSIPWNIIQFAGSKLTDIQTRLHGDLQSIQGGVPGERYHLDATQYTTVSSLGDVQVTTPAAYQLLQRDSTNAKWQNTSDLALNGFLSLPKASGSGIKVDYVTPTYGWRDITAPVTVRGVDANDPNFSVYTGTILRAYQFSASTMNEVFFVFHMPHDWVPGTDIYLHAHWSNAAAVPNTGNVVWSFDYSFAKGFSQAAFPAVTTATVVAASPAIRYTHNISEATAITIPTMEVDGLLLVRGYRDAANVLDTCTDAVFLHTMDIHYQSTNMATKNKAPSFYA